MYRSARRLSIPDIEPPDVVPMPDPSGTLSVLEAIRRQIREIGDEYADSVLQLITEYAVILTGASGAALALVTNHKMICRAMVGEPAPPLGTPVDVTHGLSGECVRTGLLVWCEDTENDPRIAPEAARSLAIGSLVAAPIVSDFGVVGLLEIFSPHPRAFSKDHETILDRLAEMIPRNLCQSPEAEDANTRSPQSEMTQPEASTTPEALLQPPAAKPDAIDSSSNESCEAKPESREPAAISAVTETSSQPEPEVVEPISERIPDAKAEKVLDAVVDQASPNQPAHTPSSAFTFLRWALFNWAFVALLIAGVSTALGYLIGFAIGKH
jgi:putative methionine-R-sulfoxide reductase with GAF domain